MKYLQWREKFDKAAVEDAVRAIQVNETAKLDISPFPDNQPVN